MSSELVTARLDEQVFFGLAKNLAQPDCEGPGFCLCRSSLGCGGSTWTWEGVRDHAPRLSFKRWRGRSLGLCCGILPSHRRGAQLVTLLPLFLSVRAGPGMRGAFATMRFGTALNAGVGVRWGSASATSFTHRGVTQFSGVFFFLFFFGLLGEPGRLLAPWQLAKGLQAWAGGRSPSPCGARSCTY